MQARGKSRAVATAYTHRGGELRVRGKRRLMHHISGRLIAKYVHAVSGNTRHVADCVRQTYRLPRAKPVIVTYNEIDFLLLRAKREKEDVLREIGEDLATPILWIGTSANLRDWKRGDLLIRAIEKVRHENLR